MYDDAKDESLSERDWMRELEEDERRERGGEGRMTDGVGGYSILKRIRTRFFKRILNKPLSATIDRTAYGGR